MDKLCVSKFCVDKLYVSKCGQVLCGQVVLGSCVCVVEEEGGGRRAGGGGQEEKAGVQNQKQEPHTKMWGKSTMHTTIARQLANLKQEFFGFLSPSAFCNI